MSRTTVPTTTGVLAGLTFTVVGPIRRREHYTEVLEQMGAVVIYAASEEKKGRVGQLCKKADAILFINTYTSHSVFEAIRAAAKERMIPVKVITTKGKERLAEAALEVAQLIPHFRISSIQQKRA